VQSYVYPSSNRDSFLAPQADNTDDSTLPPPELNPLLNPLLGQHMGRWAEVYFTSPPEKREQAVLELLHELEAADAQREDVADSATSIPEQVSVPVSFPSFRIAAELQSVGCPSCGHKNRADQRFCGMCGTRLEENATAIDLGMEDVRRPEPALAAENEENVESQFLAPRHADDEPPLLLMRRGPSLEPSPEFSTVEPDRQVRDYDRNGDEPGWTPYSTPPSNSYRLYVGAVLAMLFVVLIYIAWRGAQAKTPVAMQAPPATEQPAPPASTQSASTQSPLPAETTKTIDRRTFPVNVPVAASHGGAEKNPEAPALPGNGSEEFAMAQSYLNGTDGKERNSEEAATWLWKAVAKRNAAATLRLSDLYLKGDGVAKNCDQARVLLDAAASRGSKDAGERLRHLQSFGCE
jgi:hypothetical protein